MKRCGNTVSVLDVIVEQGASDITPLRARRFTRWYEMRDRRCGVHVAIEEGSTHCRTNDRAPCAWCREHGVNSHDEISPNTPRLFINIGGGEIANDVTADALDALIAMLIAVRERARADGALPPARVG